MSYMSTFCINNIFQKCYNHISRHSSHLQLLHRIARVNPDEAEKTGFFRVGEESFVAFGGLLRDETSRIVSSVSTLSPPRDYSSRNFSRGFRRYLRSRARYRRHFCKSHEFGDVSACVLFPDQRHRARMYRMFYSHPRRIYKRRYRGSFGLVLRANEIILSISRGMES